MHRYTLSSILNLSFTNALFPSLTLADHATPLRPTPRSTTPPTSVAASPGGSAAPSLVPPLLGIPTSISRVSYGPNVYNTQPSTSARPTGSAYPLSLLGLNRDTLSLSPLYDAQTM